MSVSGLCQICESAEATHDCNRCGALVCVEHWNRENDLCVECLAEIGGAGDQEQKPSGPGKEDITPPDTDDSTHQM
ncbi:hypothetical protein [Haladaptatus sp. NG-SE-30]